MVIWYSLFSYFNTLETNIAISYFVILILNEKAFAKLAKALVINELNYCKTIRFTFELDLDFTVTK